MSWEKKSSGTSSITNLSGLLDVDVSTGKIDGNVMTYDGASGKVKLKPSSGGSVPSGTIDPRNMNYTKVLQEQTQNIFNKDTVTMNGYYDQPDGHWVVDSAYYESDYIPVTEGIQYSVSVADLISYWDTNGNWKGYTRNKTFTVPSGQSITQVRLASLQTSLSTNMFVQGATLPLTYQPFGATPQYQLPFPTFQVGLGKGTVNSSHFSTDVQNYIQNAIEQNDFLVRASGKVNLFIETPLEGYNQPIHPKMVYFSNAWNGYKYWMAYTPYPFAISGVENPSICASNDMLNWVVPSGSITMPLDNPGDGTFVSYWSDTHLVYRADLNRLECWYRGVQDQTTGKFAQNAVLICRRTSTDGKNWNVREILYTVANSANFVSPAVYWDATNSLYRIWVANNGGYWTADGVTAQTWTKVGNTISLDGGASFTTWHWDVIVTDIGYEMVYCTNTADTNIYYRTSTDGLKWTAPITIAQTTATYGIDSGGLYRPSIHKINGYYYILHSTIDIRGVRGVTLSYSTKPNDIYSLKGIDSYHEKFMAKPTKKSKWMRQGTIFFEKNLNKPIMCITEGTSTIDATYVDMIGNVV